MDNKKLTEKDCLEEVLRLVKIFCFQKIEKSEIPLFRELIGQAMREYLKRTDEKRAKVEQAKIEREARKHERRLNAKKTV